MYMHLCVCACRGQKRVPGSLDLELEVAVSHLMWMLGIELCKNSQHS